jgi:hypothetical protein
VFVCWWWIRVGVAPVRDPARGREAVRREAGGVSGVEQPGQPNNERSTTTCVGTAILPSSRDREWDTLRTHVGADPVLEKVRIRVGGLSLKFDSRHLQTLEEGVH